MSTTNVLVLNTSLIMNVPVGLYTCVALNGIGESIVSFYIDLTGKIIVTYVVCHSYMHNIL